MSSRQRGEDLLPPNPLKGKPLELLPRSFQLREEDRIRAAMGPPAWMRRRKRLDLALERLEAELAEAWARSTPEEWRARAEAWDLRPVNVLIAEHNAYYPVERDLPMDPALGDYVEMGEPWKPLELLDAEWILRRFPPEGAGRGR